MYYFPEEEAEPDFDEMSIERPPPKSPVLRLPLRLMMQDQSRGFALFGAVPPPLKCSEEVVEKSVANLAQAVRHLKPDGINVYDIMDEKSRNEKERPFPFFQTHDPRMFAHRLEQATDTEAVLYQSLEFKPRDQFERYLHETTTQWGAKNIVFVGGAPQKAELSVPEACQMARQCLAAHQTPVFLGGVTIPERHRDKGVEHERLVERTKAGVAFFTSQVIYNADNAIALLRDYDEMCSAQGITPARLIFSFAPFGRKDTKEFLEWLGVEIPRGTAERVLRRPTLPQRIDESIQICWENMRRILDACDRLNLTTPVGVCVESVSKFRDEQKAAEDLFLLLRDELDSWYQRGCLCDKHRPNESRAHRHAHLRGQSPTSLAGLHVVQPHPLAIHHHHHVGH